MQLWNIPMCTYVLLVLIWLLDWAEHSYCIPYLFGHYVSISRLQLMWLEGENVCLQSRCIHKKQNGSFSKSCSDFQVAKINISLYLWSVKPFPFSYILPPFCPVLTIVCARHRLDCSTFYISGMEFYNELKSDLWPLSTRWSI